MESDNDSNEAFNKVKRKLLSNYYSCLSPPPCQVEEQEYMEETCIVERGRGAIAFKLPEKSKNKSTKCQLERFHRAKLNKLALKPTRNTQYREIPWAEMKEAISNTKDWQGMNQAKQHVIAAIDGGERHTEVRRDKRDKMPLHKRVYVLDYNDDEIRCGVMNGSIASTVADSGATSSVGTKNDPCKRTGQASNKVFILPGGQVAAAEAIATYPFAVRPEAAEVHITPDITSNSLLSTGKFADADYVTVFDKEQVNVYDVNDITISVTRGALLRGWRCPTTGLWRIPLLPTGRKDNINNVNTETVIVNKPPTEFLSNRPPPTEAIFNVYELRTQPELIKYYHAAAGFPTRRTWLHAIKNKHYASWTGLTYEGASKHFPEASETSKGHGRKLRSGQ